MSSVSQSKIQWVSKLIFQGDSRDHKLIMDTKGGKPELGMTPKELVLTGLCGCTGMDVISLLTSKYKLPVTQFEVSATSTTSDGGHPVVWTQINLEFLVNGDAPEDKVLQAVQLSMTKYCGVSAMLSKACPINYTVILNGVSIGTGKADFSI